MNKSNYSQEVVMTDICIPLTGLSGEETAEIIISIGGTKQQYNFRVESFPWETHVAVGTRIMLLKGMIDNYDKSWELIQIYNPDEKSGIIRVLFRKRQTLHELQRNIC
jgi:hypothetical protein